MKSVGSSSRGSCRKETFFSQLPIERLSPHKSHNSGSHFSMVWVTATEAAPEVNRKWSPEKGKNIQNAPSGLSAPPTPPREPARTEPGRKGFGALGWTKGPGPRFLTTDSLPSTCQNLRQKHTHLHINDHQQTSSTWNCHPQQQGNFYKLTRQDRGGAHSLTGAGNTTVSGWPTPPAPFLLGGSKQEGFRAPWSMGCFTWPISLKPPELLSSR